MWQLIIIGALICSCRKEEKDEEKECFEGICCRTVYGVLCGFDARMRRKRDGEEKAKEIAFADAQTDEKKRRPDFRFPEKKRMGSLSMKFIL